MKVPDEGQHRASEKSSAEQGEQRQGERGVQDDNIRTTDQGDVLQLRQEKRAKLGQYAPGQLAKPHLS